MSWTAFWNGDQSIYVSRRHLERHYQTLAQSIVGQLNPAGAVVDFGCGEALSADIVAARCARLYLCESAAAVRERVRARWQAQANIEVLDENLAGIADGSVDLLLVNSVVQYLTLVDLRAGLNLWRRKLAPAGRLVVADVLPKKASALQDALSLLQFAAAEGFLLEALAGLARTAGSSYPRLRRELGLLRFEEAEIIALLGEAGFSAVRIKNLGHNQSRMAFVANVRETSKSGAPRSSN